MGIYCIYFSSFAVFVVVVFLKDKWLNATEMQIQKLQWEQKTPRPFKRSKTNNTVHQELSIVTILQLCSKMIWWEIHCEEQKRAFFSSHCCRKQATVHYSLGAHCALNKACGCHHRYGAHTSQPAYTSLYAHPFIWKQHIITQYLAAVLRNSGNCGCKCSRSGKWVL